MKFRFLFFIILVFLIGNSHYYLFAQNNKAFDSDTSNKINKFDTSIVELRVNKRAIDSLLEEGNFEYYLVEPEEESLISQFRRWLINKIFRNLFVGEIDLVKIIVYSAFIILIGFLLYRLLTGSKSAMFFAGNEEKNKIKIGTKEELHRTNYDELLQKALSKEDYSEAVIILFHKALSLLSINELIKWRKDKTNYDYLYEIEQIEIKDRFRTISYYFAYVFYGKFIIDRKLYRKINQAFDKFFSSIIVKENV